MKTDDKRLEISVYFNEKDRYKRKILYKAILEELYRIGVTGATLFDAFAAYGGNFEIKKRSIFPWNKNRSLMLRIVERKEMKEAVLQILDEMVSGGIVTIQEVDFIRYTPTVITDEDRHLYERSPGANIGSSLLDKLD